MLLANRVITTLPTIPNCELIRFSYIALCLVYRLTNLIPS